MDLWNKKVFLFCLFVFFLFSCIKDVHINIQKEKPKLVVNCLFNPDSAWKIFVGKSMYINDTSNASVIKNANITLSGNGRLIHLTYLDSGYYVSDLKPKAGVKYTIEVTSPGFHAVEAADSIPDKPTISSFTFDTIPVIITDLEIPDQVKVNKPVLSINGLNRESYAQVKIPAYNKNDLYEPF